MSNARNIAALNTVEVGATADQTKADLNAIGVSGGRKNLIINGGMQVWQRGEDKTLTGNFNGYSTADRIQTQAWISGDRLYRNNISFTHPVSGVAVVDMPFFRAKASTAGQTARQINYKIDDIASMSGKTYTLSYLYVASSGNFSFKPRIYVTGVSGVTSFASDSNVTATNGGVTHRSFTFTVPTLTGVTAASTLWVQFINLNAASANNSINISEVQLELGSVATDFEHRSYGEELALCQRYYYKNSGESYAMPYHSSYKMAVVPFPTTMRTNPTMSATTNGTGSAWTNFDPSPRQAKWYVTEAHSFAGSSYITNMTADAEL